MTNRDRLIELIEQKQNGGWRFITGEYTTDVSNEYLADHLLANGVIVPPCKVGDKVYYVSENPINLSVNPYTIYEADVVRIVTTKLGTSLVIQIHNEYGCTEIPNIKDFGKTVFLTKEEAEAELEKRGNNNA